MLGDWDLFNSFSSAGRLSVGTSQLGGMSGLEAPKIIDMWSKRAEFQTPAAGTSLNSNVTALHTVKRVMRARRVTRCPIQNTLLRPRSVSSPAMYSDFESDIKPLLVSGSRRGGWVGHVSNSPEETELCNHQTLTPPTK
jgi:hypothetical protein